MRMRRGFAEHSGLWTMAIILSVGLHVGGLLLIACCNSGKTSSAPESEVKPAAAETVSEPKSEDGAEKTPAPEAKKMPSVTEPEIRFDQPPEQKKEPEKPSAYRKRPSERKPAAERKSLAEKKPAAEKNPQPEKKPIAARDGEPLPEEMEPIKSEPAPAEVVQTAVYVVRKGDTLTSVAKEHNCSVSALARLNRTTVKKLANLKFGQRLKVPKGN